MSKRDELLKDIYYNPLLGLGTARSLFNLVKNNGITFNYVKQWLDKQEGHQMFSAIKDVAYPAIVGSDNDFQIDLMFFDSLKQKNSGYHVIFTAIELTSRKAYAYKLKNKSETSVCDAFDMFVAAAGKINNLTSDNGSEFISNKFKKIAKSHGITQHFVDAGDKTKMGKIERFNRTLRDKITKYMKAFKTLRWEDALDNLVSNYNNTVHSRTGYKPNNVTPKIAAIIRAKEIARSQKAFDQIAKFKVGDKVRILKKKETFEKGGDRFTRSVYTIVKIDKLALIVQNPEGVTLQKRIKPYQAKKVAEIQHAPENEDIEKHSTKQHMKEVKLDRVLKRELPEPKKELVPAAPKRETKKYPQVGDRIQSLFKIRGGKTKYFEGVVRKVNQDTYTILFDDNQTLNMKKDEVELLEQKAEPVVGSRVKVAFTVGRRKQFYEGVVIEVKPSTYRIKFDDGDERFIKKEQVILI